MRDCELRVGKDLNEAFVYNNKKKKRMNNESIE